jgi:hypothetical protein
VEGGAIEEGGRLGRAFEAVAGTLKRLTLLGGTVDGLPAGACHELGAAIGKLRRLSYFHLEVFKDGADCHAVGRGLAASGGCPELFELEVSGIEKNVERLTHEPSLIVPSVRSLSIMSCLGTEEEMLLLCCGLVQVGYKHGLQMLLHGPGFKDLSSSLLACMRVIVRGGGMNAYVR